MHFYSSIKDNAQTNAPYKNDFSNVKNNNEVLNIKNDAQGKNKINIFPSRYDIHKNSNFGKISKNHSFTTEASFEKILPAIYESNYMNKNDQENLNMTHPLFNHLHNMLSWAKKIDFSDIRNPIENYADQKEIDTNRVKKFLAALIHYKFDVSTVIRYLGGNYTGEYRNVEQTIKILQESKCDDKLVAELKNLLTVGTPQKFVAHTSHKNFMDFFRYGNHSSIDKNLEKTMKTMNKEEKNQYLIPLPSWVTRFIPHIHITPQGLLMKKDKNDRLVWDGTFIPNWESICINMMLSHETEPEIKYGLTFMLHLQHIYNFRIAQPKKDIVLFDDDVKGAFRHPKYHPDIAAAFSFIIQCLLFITLGNTFGSIVSPANFEPIARARTHLAKYLSSRRDLYEKYKHIIDKVKFSEPAPHGTVFTKAKKDNINQGVKDTTITEYNMFVDDSLFCQTRDTIKHSMAASIEALYIILGFPNTEVRQNALSLDKYFDSVCSHERIQLGILINTRTLSVSLTEKRRLSMLDEMSHWHKKRKSFTLIQGVTLCGTLEFWANTSPWVRFLYLNLRSSVNRCITFCTKIAKNKKLIKELITVLSKYKNTDQFHIKERFVQSKLSREVYRCKEIVHISKAMKRELGYIKDVLSNPKKYELKTPIAHIINRVPDFTSYGDASLEAAGGFSEGNFWWHVEWPKEIKALTLKNLVVTRKCKITNKLISINLLEFVVEIINYAATTHLFQTYEKNYEYSTLLNWTDNRSAEAWIRKAATKTNKGKALQRILCNLMINNPVSIESKYIKGETNILADKISRIFSSSSTKLNFDELFIQYPQIKEWKRFHPDQELLSSLYLALLKEQDPGLCPVKKLGHTSLDNNIL